MNDISNLLPFMLFNNMVFSKYHFVMFIIYLFYNADFSKFLKKLSLYKCNVIKLEAKRIKHEYKTFYTDLFSTRFKSIWEYIKDNNFKGIRRIKEISSFDYKYSGLDEQETIESNVLIVDQEKSFYLTSDIKCCVYTYTDHFDKERSKNNTEIETIVIEIFSYTLSLESLEKFVDNIKINYETKLNKYRKGKKFIYMLFENKNDKGVVWKEYEFISKRTFNNVFFNKKNKLIENLDFFINNKSEYEKNGNSYTLGIALSGPPGTGKTSIVKSIANYLNRHIIVIPLNKIKTAEDLYECFFEETYSPDNPTGSVKFENKIILLEDIDCMTDIVKKRKENTSYKENNSELLNASSKKNRNVLEVINEDEKTITLSDILNIIDGINENTGRIIIMTSNHFDKLDPALIRPGRIDNHIKLDKADINTINEICLHYYNKISTEDISGLDKIFTPAEVINIKNNSNNLDDFIFNLLNNY
jgi:ATP-dependent 26S proteasome regulatory subunit